MNDYTRLDAIRELAFINYTTQNISEISYVAKQVTWHDIRGIIKDDINWWEAIGDLNKVEKLNTLLSKCPFRKNY